MTKLFLGRDAYPYYSYGLFEQKPKRRVYHYENEDDGGCLGFTTEGRVCVFGDEEVEWIFGPLEMEGGDVIEVEITVKGNSDE